MDMPSENIIHNFLTYMLSLDFTKWKKMRFTVLDKSLRGQGEKTPIGIFVTS